MWASVQPVSLRISGWDFYIQSGSIGTRGGNLHKTLLCNEPIVGQPKSLTLWSWAKSLKNNSIREHQQILASFRQSGSTALLGPHLWGVLLYDNRRRSLIYTCLAPRSKRLEAGGTSSEHPPFWVVMETQSGANACRILSHFVYDLRSQPLERNRFAPVRSQIASDNCRSVLITGRTHEFGQGGVLRGPTRVGRGPTFLKLIYLSKKVRRENWKMVSGECCVEVFGGTD